MTEERTSPEQAAAVERITAQLEAEADIWLAGAPQIRTAADLIVEASRGMIGMPPAAAEPFLKRQRANLDALILHIYQEGFINGGESRRLYEEAKPK